MAARPRSTEGQPEKHQPPGQKFKTAIELARQEGVDTSALLLRLTHGDVARLKRDPQVALDDISFAGGEMRYLGVRIAEGDIAASALVILQA